MVMAVFAFIYHQSFIIPETLSVEMILDQVCLSPFLCVYVLIELVSFDVCFELCQMMQILRNLTFEEQQSLYMQLGKIFQERMSAQS